MKKFIVSALALSSVFALGANIDTQTKTANAANNNFGWAEYVSLTNAPTIDGQIDDVWKNTDSMITTQPDGSGDSISATITILWNETGLYFFGEVYDTTVNASDLCNLWVSETYFEQTQDKNTCKYPYVEGAYFLCLNPYGENTYYKPSSWTKDLEWTAQYTNEATLSANGYIVEAYVPLQGDNALKLGGSIGFDVSIDSYLQEGTSIDDRNTFVYWNGDTNHWYWENPSALGEVLLMDLNTEDGSPAASEDNNGGNTGNDDNSSSQENSSTESNSENSESSSDSSSEEESLGGCGSSLMIAPLSGIVVAGVAVAISKKRRK